MTGALVTAALITGALLLVLVVPHALARQEQLRTVPAQALLLWQSVSLTGVALALLAAPVAAATFGTDRPGLLAAALLVSGLMLARVLWSGHRIGIDLRRRRARQRELVDLVGERIKHRRPRQHRPHPRDAVTVIAHANPTAYCLPGRGDRIVLSQAAVDRLAPEELGAVLAHEHAHLLHRHDLLLELFTVLHETVPQRIRSQAALQEVHLLTEVLADRRAAQEAGHTVLARALVAMATPAPTTTPSPDASPDPRLDGALRATGGHAQVKVRLRVLAAEPAPRWFATSLVAAAGTLLLVPVLLLLPLI
ncbi:M56 family metallopeptidase [Ornithinimicrobium sp. LYQ103]|uniref:M56 family metallopeptidase n=1 Tax=Ornithinimicrobium sp. LYQ103 TaxID=3378796 RepID=UPI0038551D03